MDEFIRQVLVYYDKTYRAAMGGRKADRVFTLTLKDADAVANARLCCGFCGEGAE